MPTEQEIRDWYNQRYSSQGIDSMRPYDAYPPVLDYLSAPVSGRFLDVSCGTGLLLLAASKRGVRTFGIDISDEAVRLARVVSPTSAVLAGRAEALPFDDETFDYVTCLGSLEHFLDMRRSLQEMKRVAKADAQFCITVPNANFILWRLLGQAGTEQQEVNEVLLSPPEWTRLLVDQGFKVLAIRPDRWFLNYTRVFPPLVAFRLLGSSINNLIARSIPLNSTYQLVFVLAKE